MALRQILSGGGAGGGPSLHLYSAGDGFRGEAQIRTWRRGVLQEGRAGADRETRGWWKK